MNTTSINYKKTAAGFSMIELTVAIVVIAIVASIGINSLTSLQDGFRLAKLEKDVKTLNSAVNLYRASGGSLAGTVMPQDVINKLKTSASDATVGTVVGLRGGFVDARIRAVMAEDADSDITRAIWNATAQKFELTSTGVGAREFALDAPLVAVVKEDRNTAVAYGSKDKWVWDYTDVVATRNGPDTDIPRANVLPNIPTAAGGVTVAALPVPAFSVPSGSYPAANFPMPLQLTVPASYAGLGQIFYQMNGGSWDVYHSALQLPISSTTTVSAYFASNDSDCYHDSAQAGETYIAIFDDFSGSADGKFANAEGPNHMDIEFLEDGRRFEWGTEAVRQGFLIPNSMTFEGASFENVEPETEFLIGTLTYYNGTTLVNTVADTVSLNVTLDLSSAGAVEELDFEMSLESTMNHAWQSDDQNADFVRLNNVATQFTTVLNGQTYYLVLSFGEHTPNGFTTINEFHVHEGASATGNIYGRLTTTPPTQP